MLLAILVEERKAKVLLEVPRERIPVARIRWIDDRDLVLGRVAERHTSDEQTVRDLVALLTTAGNCLRIGRW